MASIDVLHAKQTDRSGGHETFLAGQDAGTTSMPLVDFYTDAESADQGGVDSQRTNALWSSPYQSSKVQACPENRVKTVSDLIEEQFPEIMALVPGVAKTVFSRVTNAKGKTVFPDDQRFLRLLDKVVATQNPAAEDFLMSVLQNSDSVEIHKRVLAGLLQMGSEKLAQSLVKYLFDSYATLSQGKDATNNSLQILATQFIATGIPINLDQGQTACILLAVFEYINLLVNGKKRSDYDVELFSKLKNLTHELQKKIQSTIATLDSQQLRYISETASSINLKFSEKLARQAKMRLSKVVQNETQQVELQLADIRKKMQNRDDDDMDSALADIGVLLSNPNSGDINRRLVLDQFEEIARKNTTDITDTVNELYQNASPEFKRYLIKILYQNNYQDEARDKFKSYIATQPLPVSPDDGFLEFLEIGDELGLQQDIQILVTQTVIQTFSFGLWEKHWKSVALMLGLADQMDAIYLDNLLHDGSCVDQMTKLQELERIGSSEQIHQAYLSILQEGIQGHRNSQQTVGYVIDQVMKWPISDENIDLYKVILKSGIFNIDHLIEMFSELLDSDVKVDLYKEILRSYAPNNDHLKQIVSFLLENDDDTQIVQSGLLNSIAHETNLDDLEGLVLYATNVFSDPDFESKVQEVLSKNSEAKFKFTDYLTFMHFVEEQIAPKNFGWINFVLSRAEIMGSSYLGSVDSVTKDLFKSISDRCNPLAKYNFVRATLKYTTQAYSIFEALVSSGFVPEITRALEEKIIPGLAGYKIQLTTSDGRANMQSVLQLAQINSTGDAYKKTVMLLGNMAIADVFSFMNNCPMTGNLLDINDVSKLDEIINWANLSNYSFEESIMAVKYLDTVSSDLRDQFITRFYAEYSHFIDAWSSYTGKITYYYNGGFDQWVDLLSHSWKYTRDGSGWREIGRLGGFEPLSTNSPTTFYFYVSPNFFDFIKCIKRFAKDGNTRIARQSFEDNFFKKLEPEGRLEKDWLDYSKGL